VTVMTSKFRRQVRYLETRILLCFTGLLIFASILTWAAASTFNIRANLALQLFVLVVALIWLMRRTGTFLNPSALVLAAIYFWHSPVLVGRFFVTDFASSGNTFVYGESHIADAVSLISSCMGLFVLGVLLAYRPRICVEAGKSARGHGCVIPSAMAWSIYTVFALVTLLYLKYESASLTADYMEQYINPSNSIISRIYQSSKYFGVLVILILFYSSRNKEALIASAAAALVLISVSLLFGSRSMPFIYALSLLVCVDKFIYKIRGWQLALVLVGASALSFIIDHTRGLGVGMNLLHFDQTGRTVDLTHIFVNMGGSVTTVLRTMEFSAGTQPLWGYSFFEPLLFIFPRPLVEMIGFHTVEFRPSEWIIGYSADVPLGGGLGYSLLAEAYLNFRMFGSVIFFLIGWFLSRNRSGQSRRSRLLSEILVVNFAILLALHVRNDWAAYFRVLFWSYILIKGFDILEKRRHKHVTALTIKV
jgi:hypothetical protein